MVMPKETVHLGAPIKCDNTGCPTAKGPRVCRSAAGFYIGYTCKMCGPYSRESGYYATAEAAKRDLEDETWVPR